MRICLNMNGDKLRIAWRDNHPHPPFNAHVLIQAQGQLELLTDADHSPGVAWDWRYDTIRHCSYVRLVSLDCVDAEDVVYIHNLRLFMPSSVSGLLALQRTCLAALAYYARATNQELELLAYLPPIPNRQ